MEGDAPEDKGIRKSIESLGVPYLYFEEGTSPAFKQCRSALVRVPYGSLNFIVDEYFGVDASNAEVMQDMIKTYDVGQLKQKLIKHSSETPRHIDGAGNVPTNMLLFGTGTQLGNPLQHDELLRNLDGGLARRTIFAYSRDGYKPPLTGQEKLDSFKLTGNPVVLKQFTDAISRMIAPGKQDLAIYMDDASSLYMLEYQHDCEQRAEKVRDKILNAELKHRYMKVSKIAAGYAAWDGDTSVSIPHLQAAMKMVEEGEEHLTRIVHTIPLHARLAEYLVEVGIELTMSQLMSKLPWFKGTAQAREEMLLLASEYGYSNSIIINQEVRNGITFYSAEGITPTDLNAISLSIGHDQAYNYRNGTTTWDRVGIVMTEQGTHWVNHWLQAGHRKSENVVPGFNIIALDIDNQPGESNVPMQAAKDMLSDYKFMMYESKSSTPEFNRYRIVMPISHYLKLAEPIYNKFMTNIYDWLPIPLDEGTNQRCRKWLGYDSVPYYNEGKLLPAIDFLPETEASVRLQKQTNAMGDVTHVERWFVRQIAKGRPRNQSLIAYALMLVDSRRPQAVIEQAVLELNKRLSPALPEKEIKATIFVTVAKAVAAQLEDDQKNGQ